MKRSGNMEEKMYTSAAFPMLVGSCSFARCHQISSSLFEMAGECLRVDCEWVDSFAPTTVVSTVNPQTNSLSVTIPCRLSIAITFCTKRMVQVMLIYAQVCQKVCKLAFLSPSCACMESCVGYVQLLMISYISFEVQSEPSFSSCLDHVAVSPRSPGQWLQVSRFQLNDHARPTFLLGVKFFCMSPDLLHWVAVNMPADRVQTFGLLRSQTLAQSPNGSRLMWGCWPKIKWRLVSVDVENSSLKLEVT